METKPDKPDRLLRVREVLARTPWTSRTTLWKKAKAGNFPEFVDMGNGQKAMLESVFERWQQSLPPKVPGQQGGAQ